MRYRREDAAQSGNEATECSRGGFENSVRRGRVLVRCAREVEWLMTVKSEGKSRRNRGSRERLWDYTIQATYTPPPLPLRRRVETPFRDWRTRDTSVGVPHVISHSNLKGLFREALSEGKKIKRKSKKRGKCKTFMILLRHHRGTFREKLIAPRVEKISLGEPRVSLRVLANIEHKIRSETGMKLGKTLGNPLSKT